MGGIYAGNTLERRAAVLNELLLLAEEIKALIRYRRLRIEEVIEICAENENYSFDFIRFLNSDSVSPADIHEKWNEYVNNERYLTADGKKQLFMLGNMLGGGDLESQMDCLDLFSSRIRHILSDEEKTLEKRKKLVCSLGMYGGAAAVIMII